ncbi:carbon catabolite repressor protein 4 homolog 1-like [Cucurbita pepo subsp. pepo]|uniref:carbon catabolite repressor protein 4 homolog 1-like n=1 Tax=Cucurbita pepo subsp. pepo TaxID=3664 RepID=UPI000C9D46A8|nr:carbon catabolite repressor protein 4 homolog 1-like [Cucurbita pepo subsp. pepo]XP_023527598.1 carbon catabolite repressor protein 4 homolog 1-like [Cucurbita pepo subsp. pepo]XP_023527599.1 carbon catabolite repressor protein 4 homolog 1-like [Cucurbita pepo subsp. pepo]XP_023527601.1 carbon catabolite repressor protein 4 homolog 1-like [Cucurbita pepo subsp. pepo]
MLSVVRVHLPSDIPIVGCELTPYVLHRRPDKNISTDDVSESAPIDGQFLRYRWYRLQSDKKVAVCSVHPSEQATLQCLGCVKAKIPAFKSYHCTTKCFSDSWQHHRVLHDRAASAMNENGNEEEELFGRSNNNNSAYGVLNSSSSSSTISTSLTNGLTPLYPAAVTQKTGVETWLEVGRYKSYTPTAEDIGHVLKFECAVVDMETMLPVASPLTVLTSRVIPAPSASPRCLIPVNGVDVMGKLDLDGRVSSGTFTVLSYNILADVYATNETFSYCPSWALSWPYRRQNLLREIVGYRADIICLQEVQSDHFMEFFAPELDKHGYQALYKRKTNELYNGNIQTIDGCATFFRRDRFAHVKKYEVEFNKAAQSLTDPATILTAQKRNAINRLIKDDVALIVVLESKFSTPTVDNPGKRQLVCVANTHINGNQDLKDVKLWQVHTLLKGLEKIAVSADIPMLVCGDFNSVPGSAPHHLLARGKVEPTHPDLAIDPLNLCQPHSKLSHQLPLVSAYSSFAIKGVGIGLDKQRKRLDPTTNEPLFTNCTRDFIGTLDYIFYTADTLTVESLLELLDEESLRKDTALPSPVWSSDHIALLAEFRCKSRPRR